MKYNYDQIEFTNADGASVFYWRDEKGTLHSDINDTDPEFRDAAEKAFPAAEEAATRCVFPYFTQGLWDETEPDSAFGWYLDLGDFGNVHAVAYRDRDFEYFRMLENAECLEDIANAIAAFPEPKLTDGQTIDENDVVSALKSIGAKLPGNDPHMWAWAIAADGETRLRRTADGNVTVIPFETFEGIDE